MILGLPKTENVDAEHEVEEIRKDMLETLSPDFEALIFFSNFFVIYFLW